MSPAVPKAMKAVVIDKFGPPRVLHAALVPVPELGDREILVRIRLAGVGSWDPWMREGGASGGRFPLILGTDGAGTVEARGSKARRFNVGDSVYSYIFDNPKGGFYAEYAAIPEDEAAAVPSNISLEEAGALAAAALTALRGLDKLRLKSGQTLLILGASGGVGHIALQLAKRIGLRTLAVASRRDGVDLVRRLGTDMAVNGQGASVLAAVRDFAPDGLDGAIAFANSESLAETLKLVKKDGRIAHPNGVEPKPDGRPGVMVHAYDGASSPEAYERLNSLISKGPFQVVISRAYKPEEAAQAHRDVLKHHIGKLGLKMSD